MSSCAAIGCANRSTQSKPGVTFHIFDNPFHYSGSLNDARDGQEENDENRGNFSTFDNEFQDMFRQIEDVFSSMFGIHSGFLDFPNLEMPTNEPCPRDFMLKEPESPHCEKPQCIQPFTGKEVPLRDTDLDEEFAKKGFSAIYEEAPVVEKAPKKWSFHKSVSTKFVRLPDGVVEEHKTVTDSDGKTVTTVRKTIGDKSYQITTESDKTGIIEKKEDFINMDEKDVQQFAQEWDKTKSKSIMPRSSQQPQLTDVAPPGDPKYMNIFKKFFG